MVLSQNLNEFHKLKQITKKGIVNVQRMVNVKKGLQYSDFF